MTEFGEVSIGDLFVAVNGRAKFTRDYVDARPGIHPVFSASLSKPFGYVDEFEFDGHFLTWVMNGYGGYVRELRGKFSVNRDRGVFVPREGVCLPDLTYLRYAMEPMLRATAVGRRVDGSRNEYTKIYPEAASDVVVQLLLNEDGQFDYHRMAELGARLRRIEAAQTEVRLARDALLRAEFPIDVPEPSRTVSLSDKAIFALSIGERVLRVMHTQVGVPVYSANALKPFGFIEKSNLASFDKPSLLWGIDGNYDWNLIPAGEIFATTDHCGRLQIVDECIDPEYVYWFLSITRGRYGFDRTYRASLRNMEAEVTVTIPVDSKTQNFSLQKQREWVRTLRGRERARRETLETLEDVLEARMATA